MFCLPGSEGNQHHLQVVVAEGAAAARRGAEGTLFAVAAALGEEVLARVVVEVLVREVPLVLQQG